MRHASPNAIRPRSVRTPFDNLDAAPPSTFRYTIRRTLSSQLSLRRSTATGAAEPVSTVDNSHTESLPVAARRGRVRRPGRGRRRDQTPRRWAPVRMQCVRRWSPTLNRRRRPQVLQYCLHKCRRVVRPLLRPCFRSRTAIRRDPPPQTMPPPQQYAAPPPGYAPAPALWSANSIRPRTSSGARSKHHAGHAVADQSAAFAVSATRSVFADVRRPGGGFGCRAERSANGPADAGRGREFRCRPGGPNSAR